MNERLCDCPECGLVYVELTWPETERCPECGRVVVLPALVATADDGWDD